MGELIQLNVANFQKEVTESKTPVIIDFWAPWCGPCRMMAPVFEELSKEYAGKLKFVKMNTEENHVLAQQYQIMGIPCLIIVSKGAEVDRIVGFAQKAALKEQIDKILAKV